MGISSPADVLIVPGDLVVGATDLTTDSPFGGTIIGEVRDKRFRAGARTYAVAAEEWGGQTVEVIYGRQAAILACVLRSWDEDALGAVFPIYSTGASGRPLIVGQPVAGDATTVRAGRALSTLQGVALTFAPRDLDRHPWIHLYNAVPAVEEASELRLEIDDEVGIPVVWHGLPDDQGRTHAIGMRGDITL